MSSVNDNKRHDSGETASLVYGGGDGGEHHELHNKQHILHRGLLAVNSTIWRDE